MLFNGTKAPRKKAHSISLLSIYLKYVYFKEFDCNRLISIY